MELTGYVHPVAQDYPRLLHRGAGESRSVADASEQAIAEAEGWSMTPYPWNQRDAHDIVSDTVVLDTPITVRDGLVDVGGNTPKRGRPLGSKNKPK